MLRFVTSVLDVIKVGTSRVLDAIVFARIPRTPIPSFHTPPEVWKYLEARYTYTGDWWNGKLDFNVDPEKFQTALVNGTADKLPIDCDDVALWAYKALLTIPNCQPYIKAIYDPYPSPGAHCICVFELNGRYGSIDTNGYRELQNLNDDTICKVFTDVYRMYNWRYVMVKDVHRAF